MRIYISQLHIDQLFDQYAYSRLGLAENMSNKHKFN